MLGLRLVLMLLSPSQTPFADSTAAVIVIENTLSIPLTVSLRYGNHQEVRMGKVFPGPIRQMFVLPSAGLGVLAGFVIVLTAPDSNQIVSPVERHVGVMNLHVIRVGLPPAPSHIPARSIPVLVPRAVSGIHVDAERLDSAAVKEGVPEIIAEGIAAVESGYRGGNYWRGAAGEIGRYQIRLPAARAAKCGTPYRLSEYAYNIQCGVKILKLCHSKYRTWGNAIQCYNSMSLSPSSLPYKIKVQREMGKILLAKLDGGL